MSLTQDTFRLVAFILHLPFFFIQVIPLVSCLFKWTDAILDYHQTISSINSFLKTITETYHMVFPESRQVIDAQLLDLSIVTKIRTTVIILLLFTVGSQLLTLVNIFIFHSNRLRLICDSFNCSWLIFPLLMEYDLVIFTDSIFVQAMHAISELTAYTHTTWPLQLTACGICMHFIILVSCTVPVKRKRGHYLPLRIVKTNYNG